MNVTVYCGSSFGENPHFADAACELGAWIAKGGHTLVYGGTHVGLMGLIADTVLDGGGHVIGVLPKILYDREPPYERLPELLLATTMAERKTKMISLGDVYVALPGGPGTLEELSELMSLVKLGVMPNKLFVFNIDGFYDELVALYDRMLAQGFMTEDMRAAMLAPCSARELTDELECIAGTR